MKRFNILIDNPPVACEVNGRNYRIQTDFKTAIAYIRLQTGDDDDEDKARFGLSMFYGDEIALDDIEGLLEYLEWFLRRGQERDDTERGSRAPTFDIMTDAGRIYAAFMQIYRINLRTARIHWWTFGELLEGLPKGTHLADVIELRGRKFETWMKPADRNELQRAKDRYRIGEAVDVMDNLFTALKGIAR